jgi:hypothetical protein
MAEVWPALQQLTLPLLLPANPLTIAHIPPPPHSALTLPACHAHMPLAITFMHSMAMFWPMLACVRCITFFCVGSAIITGNSRDNGSIALLRSPFAWALSGGRCISHVLCVDLPSLSQVVAAIHAFSLSFFLNRGSHAWPHFCTLALSCRHAP